MKKRKSSYTLYGIAYAISILVLVVCISILFSIKAQSKSQTAALFDNSQYKEAEAEYRSQLNDILDKYKCFNSGINVTRTVSVEGQRDYKVGVHNRRFGILSDIELKQLQTEVQQLKISNDESVQISVNLTGITG